MIRTEIVSHAAQLTSGFNRTHFKLDDWLCPMCNENMYNKSNLWIEGAKYMFANEILKALKLL